MIGLQLELLVYGSLPRQSIQFPNWVLVQKHQFVFVSVSHWNLISYGIFHTFGAVNLDCLDCYRNCVPWDMAVVFYPLQYLALAAKVFVIQFFGGNVGCVVSSTRFCDLNPNLCTRNEVVDKGVSYEWANIVKLWYHFRIQFFRHSLRELKSSVITNSCLYPIISYVFYYSHMILVG